MKRHRRVALALVVSAALVSSTVLSSGSYAAPKPSGPLQPPAVATPAAATLSEVTMTCSQGQTDINRATLAQLVDAFAIDSAVAARLIGFRPYLAVSDLLVVQGIGADKLAAITQGGRGCATPFTNPPPAPFPCANVDKVDLQSASADQVARVTGVNKNAAERVVTARPFATLRHVTPERVPGVGKGILDTVIARSCLTPQPIREAGTSWRWGYPAYDTTAHRDGYALKAPVGVIDATAGAWLSIKPLATPEDLPGPAYPRADFHISGLWAGARTPGGAPDVVLVTVPAASFADHFDPARYAPYLKHISPGGVVGGGENVYDPSKVVVDTVSGSVTAPVTSLSIIEWATRALNYVIEPAEGLLFGNRFPAPTCPTAWTQRPGSAIYDSPAGAHADLTSALLNLPGNTPPVGGFLIKHCVQNGPGANSNGQDVQALLRNTSGTVQMLKRYSGDVTVAEKDPSGLEDGDLVSFLVTNVNTDGNLYLAPGDTGTAEVKAGHIGAVQMQPDRLRSLLKVGGDKTLGEVFDYFGANEMYSDPGIRNWLVQAVSCIYNGYKATAGGNGFLNSSRDFAVALYGCLDYEGVYALIENWMRGRLASGAMDGAGAVRINRGLEHMREAFKWLEFGQIVVDVSDAVIWGSLPTSPTMIEHYAAKPVRDALGRVIKPACLRPQGYTWQIDMTCQNAAYAQQQRPSGGGGETGLPLGKMIRDTDGHAWLVTSADQKMHSIPDGGTYICLSKHYAIDWGLDSDDLRAYQQASGPAGNNATCNGSLPATRKITKADNADLFAVLRIDDGPESWVVLGGYRYAIPTGAEFNCWVNPIYRANIEIDVYDFVSTAELQTWPIGNGLISNCGDPENPSF